MTQMSVITIERRRYAALIDALKLARYAMLRSDGGSIVRRTTPTRSRTPSMRPSPMPRRCAHE